jgi:hypothetical protein
MPVTAAPKTLGRNRRGGKWPVHDDRDPSLSIRSADEKSASRRSVKDSRRWTLVRVDPKMSAGRHFEDLPAVAEPRR